MLAPLRRPLAAALGLALALGVSLTSGPAATADPTPAPVLTVAKTKAGSCKRFKNRTGITSRTIRIGNASDISGPVPGLFTSAQQATKAYVAYFNASKRICGRKLALDLYDTRTSTAAGKEAYVAACRKDFAAIGSVAAFDAGGARTAQDCKLPDVRVAAISKSRNGCTTCFGVNASRAGEAPNSVPDYFVAQKPAATQKAAMLSINAGSAPDIARTQQKVAEKRGFTFVYTSVIDVAEFNYGPYVQLMKSKGVRIVHFVGAYQQSIRLADAMQTAGFKPDAFVVGEGAYTAAYAAAGGAAVNGSTVAISSLPLTADQAELNRYRKWLQKVAPGAAPTTTGLYAWSAAKLFAQQAISLGGKLSRTTLNKRLRSVTTWTGGGLHAPMRVGTKHVSPCTRLLTLKSGAWVPLGGSGYRCSGVTKVG